MGSQESLSSHSSEKNGLSQNSPLSSPPADPGASSVAPASPPAAPSCSPSHNCSKGKDQKPSTESIASHHLTPSSSWTSSQLNPAQQTSSVSSMSSLLSVERTLSAKGNSTASLSSVKESNSPSRASSSTISIQHCSVERTSSLREGRAVQRVSSVCSLKSTHSVDQRNASGTSSIVTETRMTESTSPSRQQRTAYRTASSSSSSSSSLFPYPLSTSSSLTSLHISEGTYISFEVWKNKKWLEQNEGWHINHHLLSCVLLQIIKAVMDRYRVSCRWNHTHVKLHTPAVALMWPWNILQPQPATVTRGLDHCEYLWHWFYISDIPVKCADHLTSQESLVWFQEQLVSDWLKTCLHYWRMKPFIFIGTWHINSLSVSQ